MGEVTTGDTRAVRWARRAEARAAWAGNRWWLPGAVAAAAAVVVGWLATEAWYAFEAGGCGSPGAKFECLGEALVAIAVAPVLGPVLLWLLYRSLGVRRPVLGVPVAAAVGFCLLALPELTVEVRLLAGSEPQHDDPPGALVGVLLGLAVLGGGLAWQGPRRAVRAGAAALALALLVITVLALSGPADRVLTATRLERAEVPLLLPDPGWQPYSPYVADDGTLSYEAVPVGWDGYGFVGVDVEVTRDLDRFGDTCGFRACIDEGDVRVEVPEEGDTGLPTAWRVVDGVLVTVTTYDAEPPIDPVAFLQGTSPATVEQVLDREFPD